MSCGAVVAVLSQIKPAVSPSTAAAAMAAAGEVPGKAEVSLETAAGGQLVGVALQTQTATPKKTQTSLARFFSRPDSTSSAAQQESTKSVVSETALVAVKPACPQTPPAKRKLTLAEQGSDQPVNKRQTDTRPVHRRGGRPKKTDDSKKSSYTVLTGTQRIYIIQAWDQKIKAGTSTRTARQQIASLLSCSTSAVKTTVQNKEYWLEWAEEHKMVASTSPNKARKPGDKRSKLKLGTTSKGCRKPGKRGYLGNTNWCRPLIQKVMQWSEMETEQGHDLGKSDLYTQFTRLLDSAVAYGKDAEEAGTITPEEMIELKNLMHKQARLASKASCRRWQERYLVGQCGFADRKKQRTTALSTDEERVRVRRGWQHWDRLLWFAGCGKTADLQEYVMQPERWEVERRHAVISMSDQVPSWLMPAGDRKLVSKAHVRKCGQARKLRATRAMIASGAVQTEEQQCNAEEQPRQLVCVAGTPAMRKPGSPWCPGCWCRITSTRAASLLAVRSK